MRRSAWAMVAAGLVAVGLVPSPGASAADDAGQVRPGFLTSPSSGRALDIALGYVKEHRQSFGLTAGDVADLLVTDTYRSGHSGVTHVYLRQRLHGLEVLGADTTVNVARDGAVLFVGSGFLPHLASAASGRVAIGPARALERAARELAAGDLRRPVPARLVYQPLGDGRLRLAWDLEIEELSGEHWWNASVDAETGALLARIDHVDRDNVEPTAAAVARPGGSEAAVTTPAPAGDGAKYRVFALPLESPNDGDRNLATDPADALASPFGWHDTDGASGHEFITTQGNNVHAYIDTFNAGMALPLTDADGGDDLVFDFPFDPAAPPTANKDAAVTNLFYWNNIVHDVFYRYGFDEASGNFQVNNYGRGGVGNDSVRAEAQDGSGVNNANFSTPADGSRPRMQMYVWTSTLASSGRFIDGDFDSGVIAHEYGHGISHRLTGGPSNVSCLSHQERPSEGWSDWLAIALTALPTESGPQRRGMGTYVLGQANRQAAGIRPTPYSTNMSINGATYDDIKTLAVPHGVGYVWATMLWEVFWDLVGEYGFNPNPYDHWTTGGNNLAIQLVIDGMKFQKCSPGFVDARNAILAADVALTGGVNQCLVWRGFAKRGLGFSAKQGSSTSRSDGTEAFDMPPNCST